LTAGHHKKLNDLKRYGKGDTILLTKFEAEKIKHRLEPLEPVSEKVDENAREEIKLRKVHKGAGRYIVINELTEKTIHDGTVSKEQAQKMIDNMLAEVDESEEDESDKEDKKDESEEEDKKEDEEDEDWDDEDKK
jgi:hypothetical protein